MGVILSNCPYFYSEFDLAFAMATSETSVTRMQSFVYCEPPLELTASRLRQPRTVRREGAGQLVLNLAQSESISRGQRQL